MTLNSTVVIFIQDYLDKKELLTMSDESSQTASNFIAQRDVISFPSEAEEEVTKEEIGKWVDQLMEMPEPEVSSSVFAHEGCNDLDDPLTCVAERILSEESYL
jgi:hypothetical protein